MTERNVSVRGMYGVGLDKTHQSYWRAAISVGHFSTRRSLDKRQKYAIYGKWKQLGRVAEVHHETNGPRH